MLNLTLAPPSKLSVAFIEALFGYQRCIFRLHLVSIGEIFNLKFDLPIPFGMGAAGADTTGGLAKAIGLGGGGGNPLPE